MFKTLTSQQRMILFVLAFINFFNYVDRQVIFPLFHNIQLEFGINDFQLGLLGSVFMLIHSLASLPLGVLADRYSRRVVISTGVLFWSIATFASGMASSFKTLLGIRSLVGIGEAAYAPAATAMISDNTPPAMRAQAQGVFNAGMFIGGTVGAMLGGVIAYYTGNWRYAFFLVAFPGIFLAWLANRLSDHKSEKVPDKMFISQLFKNTAYRWVLISGIFTTFAVGAFVSWGVEFVVRYKGYNLRDTSLILGGTLMVAGVLGVVLGSYFADKLQEKFAWGRSVVVGGSLMLAAPIMFLGITNTGSNWLFFLYFFVGTTLLSFYHGPSTAVMHDVVPKYLRATAFALYILVIHLLGDTPAPAVVGKISDHVGLRSGLAWCTLLVFVSGLSFIYVSELIRKNKVQLIPED